MDNNEPFEFQQEHDSSLSLESAVFQALGAASTCWESLHGTGVFQSDRAKEIGEVLMAKIREETKPQAKDLPTRELLAEIAIRMEISQNSTSGRALGRMCRDALHNLDDRVLDYRTVESG